VCDEGVEKAMGITIQLNATWLVVQDGSQQTRHHNKPDQIFHYTLPRYAVWTDGGRNAVHFRTIRGVPR
jgi:hypothetical protein